MIQITPQMRVLVAVKAADFRRGIDGLARLCREALGADQTSSPRPPPTSARKALNVPEASAE